MLMDFAVLLEGEFQFHQEERSSETNLRTEPRNLGPATLTLLFNGKTHTDFSGVKPIPWFGI